jgi:hypothetical protein
VPLGLAAIPLVLTKLRESRGPDSGLDLRGLALISAAVLSIVWGLMRGNEVGWAGAEPIAALLAGAALVGAFVAWERRAREPMLPIGLFRSRGFAAANGAIFFTFAALFGAVFFYAQLLQIGLGYGPLESGLRLLPWTATRPRREHPRATQGATMNEPEPLAAAKTLDGESTREHRLQHHPERGADHD